MLEKEAITILEYIGGADNVINLVHCATRLRFELKDDTTPNKHALEQLPYVLSVVKSGGQFQVVIGSKVNSYYSEIMKHLTIDESTSKKQKFSILKIISGAFSPLIPVMAGAGMLKALLTVFVQFQIISDTSSTYAVLSAAGNAVFYFLPIFLGITLSKQLGANQYVGGAIGAALMEPSFTALIQQDHTDFFGISITAVDYASTVFPIFIISFVFSYLEKGLKRIIKQELQMFLVPMLCLFILVPLAVIVFGPFGTVIGNYVSQVIMWLFSVNKVIAGAVIGTTYPFLTILGLHWGFTPITLQNLTEIGGDIIEGAAVCCVFAEIGIAIGAYLRSKKHSTMREIAGPTILTGFLAGVTEPILYGIIMRYKRLIFIVAISGAVGGAINGLFNVMMNAYVFHNVFSIAMMTYSPFIPFLIGISTSCAIGIFLTYTWGFSEDDKKDLTTQSDTKIQTNSTNIHQTIVHSPLCGNMISLTNVEDEVFSSKAAGDGVAILPSKGKVFAPFDGEIIAVFPSKHAIGLRSTNGVEVLIHVGLNTVMLNGKYYTLHVKQGDYVKQHDLLIEFDIEKIKAEGYSLVTPILLTNTNDYTYKILDKEEVTIHDTIITVE